MKKPLPQIFVLVFLFLHSSISFGQINTESLLDHLESYRQKRIIPGAMISIVKADTTIFVGGLGYADIEKQEKVTDQHLFRQGSISKSFTALGLLKLLKESPHSLNSPITAIDPQIPFTNKWREEKPVRVSHLLEHTSGFEDFHLHAIYNTKDHALPPVLNMVEDHRPSLHSRWPPGTKKAYSNPNYILAGHLIEKIAKTSFDQYIKENILQTMGMNAAGYYFKKPPDQLFAQGYQRTETRLDPIPFATINGSPAGDFCANAKDMANYLQHLLRRDTTLFTPDEFARIETPKTSLAAKQGLRVGYGLGNYSVWKNGFLFHGHGGEIEGYTARYLYSRAADLGIAIAINRNANANEMMEEILNYCLASPKQATKERSTSPIPDSIKNKFSGFYEFNSPKSELIAFSDKMLAGLSLDFQHDKVITRTLLGKAKDTLYYAGHHQFYRNGEGVPSVLLLEPAVGETALWINDHYTERKPRWKRLLLFFGLLLSFLLLTSFSLHSLIRFLRNRFRKDKKSLSQHWPLLGVSVSFLLLLTGLGISLSDPKALTGLTFPSLLFYLSSYALVLLSFFSLYRGFQLPQHNRFKTIYLLTSLGALAISFYLWDIGFIGLKLWAY